MSKPSDKSPNYAAMGAEWMAKRIADDDRFHEKVMECAIKYKLFKPGQTVNAYSAFERIEELLVEHVSALEAQHRKTWALAIDAAKDAVRPTVIPAMWDDFHDGLANAVLLIDELPCQPIEATKDK